MDRSSAVDAPARRPENTKSRMNEAAPHPDIRIGHVHLRVADLDRATAFYRDVLRFDVTAYGPDFGLPSAAFLSSGGTTTT
jgi:catechol 2,3-dioxygenase